MARKTETAEHGSIFFSITHIILLLSFISALLLTLDVITIIIPPLGPLFPTIVPIPGGNLIVLIPSTLFFSVLGVIAGFVAQKKAAGNRNELRYARWTFLVGIYGLAVSLLLFFLIVSGFNSVGQSPVPFQQFQSNNGSSPYGGYQVPEGI